MLFDCSAYFFFGLTAVAGFSVLITGGLPITPLSGQILNAGHFSQLLTMAMGQRVMVGSGFSLGSVCPSWAQDARIFAWSVELQRFILSAAQVACGLLPLVRPMSEYRKVS